MNEKHRLLVVAFVIALIGGFVGAWFFSSFDDDSQEELIQDFYQVENAAVVSPHSLRKMMARGDDSFVLVDVRSADEYQEAHIAGAINIPAYKDKDTSDYGAVDRIVSSFAALPDDKTLIVYCYSGPCMTGRKVGLMLAKQGIYVHHLGIGWNEWRYDWTSWNHEHEWNQTNVMDYIVSGSAPGRVLNASVGCPVTGGLGC